MKTLEKELVFEQKRPIGLVLKIILPSVLYGLIAWGGCPNTDLLHSMEILHRRTATIIYNLPRDMPTDEVH